MTESVSRSGAGVADAPEQSWRPEPWRAALLSLVSPLVAYLYDGRPRRAVAVTAVLQVCLAGGIVASLVVPGRVLRIALLALTILAPFTVVPWDAWRIARATGTQRRRWYQRWYVLLTMLTLWALAIQPQIFDAVRRYVSEAYRIPAGGMAPTLIIGDHILVSKWDNAAARRGDVVVFSDATGRNYVQRAVGLPGDTLAMQAHALLVNGDVLPEPYAHMTASVDPADALGNWGPLVVPIDQYFLLGDNRGSSYDSRYRGFVTRAEIRGRARWVYYSRSTGGDIEWSRIGVSIR